MKILKLLICTGIFIFAVIPFSFGQRIFVHPGLSHKLSDFQRMKYMVELGIDPWYTSYINLLNESKASYDYTVQGNSSMTVVTQDGTNYSAFASDVKAAYLNAVMWGVTDDKRYAEKAVEIFNAWQNLTCFTGGGTESLNAGRVAWQFIEAAEIIKSTYDGWSASDIQKFKDMLVYPGYSTKEVPASLSSTNGTFYWRVYNGDPGRHGNQDLFGWRTVMALGVFLDNDTIYDRALRYVKGLPHRSDDLPYEPGPAIKESLSASYDYYDYYNVSRGTTEEDYGYDGVLEYYIWENGQCQESSRDQDHAILGMGMVASIAEMAWNQGDDLYSYLDNRLLKGYEFALRYNVSYNYSYPDQTSPWEPTVASGEFIQRADRTLRWYSKAINPHYESDFVSVSRGNFLAEKRPIYEQAIAQYSVRQGLPNDSLKWTIRAHEISNDEGGYEKTGWSLDHLGWGGLTMHRPDSCACDPCYYNNGNPVFAMHLLPDTIEAENYDYFSGAANGRSYYDVSTGNSGGEYRTSDDVDIEVCSSGGYNLTDIDSSEWLSYTVYVPVVSTYDIKINYAASNGNGKIRFAFGSEYVTDTVNIPFGGEYSTGLSDWKYFTVEDTVKLDAGVQSMRVYFPGVSDAFKLNNIVIVHHPVGDKDISLNAEENEGVITLQWIPINIIPDSVSIYRGTIVDFASGTVIANNLSGTHFIDNSIESGVVYYYWAVAYESGIAYTSDSTLASAKVGYIEDEFDNSTDGWIASTDGASVESRNGQLLVELTEVKTNVFRGDMKREEGADLHPRFYPIVAIRIQLPQVVNLHFDTNLGSYGNGSNKWTGKIGDEVFYYDLTTVGFGSSGTILPNDKTTSLTTFQFKVADITSGEHRYVCDWVRTFKSLADLQAFVTTDTTGRIPVSDFGADTTSIFAGNEIQFNNYSLNYPTSWMWDFGDGTTSTEENPSHIYSEAGTYSVKLKVINKYGVDSLTFESYITVTPLGYAPVADFSASETTVLIKEIISFSDNSIDDPTSWIWDFGDGSQATDQNPIHRYDAKGLYTVSLIASNVFGADTLTKSDYILVDEQSANITENDMNKISWNLQDRELELLNLPFNSKIEIFNLSGRSVERDYSISGTKNFYLDEAGVYIVVIQNTSGVKTVKIHVF